MDPGNKDATAQFKAMQSPERVAEMMKSMQEFNNRVRTRAQSVLTPAQLNAFQSAQEQQVQMMEMGLKMSQQMFGAGARNAGAPPPPGAAPSPK